MYCRSADFRLIKRNFANITQFSRVFSSIHNTTFFKSSSTSRLGFFRTKEGISRGAALNKRKFGLVKISSSALGAGTLATFFYLNVNLALTQPTSIPPMEELDFDNTRIAFQNKSTGELIRSLLVYNLCSFQILVDRAGDLISLGEKFHLGSLMYWFIKKSFFAQFCSGETAEECVTTILNLQKSGIGSILELSIEADLYDESMDQNDEIFRKQWNSRADHVADMNIKCVQAASVQPNNFTALKLTGLVNPVVLQRLSRLLIDLSKAFQHHVKDEKLSKSNFLNILHNLNIMNSDSIVEDLFAQADSDKDGMIDFDEYTNIFSLADERTREIFLDNIPYLTLADLKDYDQILRRLDNLCEFAKERNVRLLIDAEQTHFQPAIDYIAMQLAAKHNRPNSLHGPIVFITYQMYLKDSGQRLVKHYEQSRRRNFTFASKLVRGAYMTSERKRAATEQIPDPIHETLEDTHSSYNNGVEFLLKKIHEAQITASKPLNISNIPVVFMIASHNKESVIKADILMKTLEISPQSGFVLFGQLLGMRDQITYTLSHNGYPVYKNITYGQINQVIPFLIRRAQENNSVLGGSVIDERQILWKEISHRFNLTSRSITNTTSR
ncbi:hypothetical protein G9A89_010151 [Geosiphon pyriformis]|nr:hypothetical protein G9A89_010151 [Geosiphon pyriformis]